MIKAALTICLLCIVLLSVWIASQLDYIPVLLMLIGTLTGGFLSLYIPTPERLLVLLFGQDSSTRKTDSSKSSVSIRQMKIIQIVPRKVIEFCLILVFGVSFRGTDVVDVHLTLRHLIWMGIWACYNGFFIAEKVEQFGENERDTEGRGDVVPWGHVVPWPTMVTPDAVKPVTGWREIIFWHDFWLSWIGVWLWISDYCLMIWLCWKNKNSPEIRKEVSKKSCSRTSSSTSSSSSVSSSSVFFGSFAKTCLVNFFGSYLAFDFFSAFWHSQLDNDMGTHLNGGRRTYTEDHHTNPQIFNKFTNYELLAYTYPPMWCLQGWAYQGATRLYHITSLIYIMSYIIGFHDEYRSLGHVV